MKRSGGAASRWRQRLGRWLEALLPPACVLCGRAVEPGRAPACRLCLHRLPRMDPPWCPRCGATRSRPGARPDPGARSLWGAAGTRAAAPVSGCAECRGWDPALAGAAAPFRMRGGALELVHSLKYGGWFSLARAMGSAMAPAARRVSKGRPHVLVPVPLAPERLRERGYNQAELLARRLSGELGWPWRPWLERAPGGRPQARLTAAQRRANVRGAFRTRLPRGVARRPGPVLLVDDVVTTGATAGACARALQAVGRGPVRVVAFARALHARASSTAGGDSGGRAPGGR